MIAFWNRWWRKSRDVSAERLDCAAVLERLYEYLDEEIEDLQTVEKIRAHLEICRCCCPRFEFEQAFLKFVAELGRTEMPPDLRRRVLDQILTDDSA